MGAETEYSSGGREGQGLRPELAWSQWGKKGKTTHKYWKVRVRACRN